MVQPLRQSSRLEILRIYGPRSESAASSSPLAVTRLTVPFSGRPRPPARRVDCAGTLRPLQPRSGGHPLVLYWAAEEAIMHQTITQRRFLIGSAQLALVASVGGACARGPRPEL